LNGFRFDRFTLDATDRRLTCEGEPVELNARYFDALALLVREHGRLVTKERFLDEVWRGVPVTDEALTQCVRTLRRALGDDATRPRFIETAPKHGYRFIAPVEALGQAPAPPMVRPHRTEVTRRGLAGTLGGALTGVIVGLLYGFGVQPGIGAVSVLLVLICLSIGLGVLAAAGVAFGIALAGLSDWRRAVLGGALGGLFVGAVAKLLGVDAFNLLFGRAPTEMTGAGEGLLLGAALGLSAWLAARHSLRRGVVIAAAITGAVGGFIPLVGGRLLGGSLDLLAQRFPDSHLSLDGIAALLGENRFGPLSQSFTGALEAAIFGACVVGAMLWVGKSRLNQR
jgi:DNA-binding winged helix-turn-helix (wHTH) protein